MTQQDKEKGDYEQRLHIEVNAGQAVEKAKARLPRSFN
jgi:hypothetical protein